jgi:hypothetical protein
MAGGKVSNDAVRVGAGVGGLLRVREWVWNKLRGLWTPLTPTL